MSQNDLAAIKIEFSLGRDKLCSVLARGEGCAALEHWLQAIVYLILGRLKGVKRQGSCMHVGTRQTEGQGHARMHLSRFDFGMENMFCSLSSTSL